MNVFAGRMHLLSLVDSTFILWKTDQDQQEAEEFLFPHSFKSRESIEVSLHINAQRQSLSWEIPGKQFKTDEFPLPSPSPVYLLYQTGDCRSTITCLWAQKAQNQ